MDSVYLINNAKVISAGVQRVTSVLIRSGRIVGVGEKAISGSSEQAILIDGSGCSLIPGLIDAHCHISFDLPKSNDELFFHRRPCLAAVVAPGVRATV